MERLSLDSIDVALLDVTTWPDVNADSLAGNRIRSITSTLDRTNGD